MYGMGHWMGVEQDEPVGARVRSGRMFEHRYAKVVKRLYPKLYLEFVFLTLLLTVSVASFTFSVVVLLL